MKIFSLNWVLSTLMSTIITMVFIYLIKRATSAVKIPVVSDIAQSV